MSRAWAVIVRTAADPAWTVYVTTGTAADGEEKARSIAAALNAGQEAALDSQPEGGAA
jgi:hypothetical protein